MANINTLKVACEELTSTITELSERGEFVKGLEYHDYTNVLDLISFIKSRVVASFCDGKQMEG